MFKAKDPPKADDADSSSGSDGKAE
jgi:hypothetical protein